MTVIIKPMDHSRFLVNQTKNSRSKTTTIPRFATLRQTRLDYAIEPRFSNRASIFQSSLHFPIEPPFSNRASIFQSSLVSLIEARIEKKKKKEWRRGKQGEKIETKEGRNAPGGKRNLLIREGPGSRKGCIGMGRIH